MDQVKFVEDSFLIFNMVSLDTTASLMFSGGIQRDQ